MTFLDQLRDALGPGYRIERELSGGGMSRVFVALEVGLSRSVVVKVLPPELAAGVNRDRFRREIQLAAQLQHPHIVPLLSAGEQGDLLWYTMPFIEGESLRGELESGRRLTTRQVVRVLHDVVDALAYAHQRGVIHRDIKPANILMHGAHALVTDFGVAKAISAALPSAGATTGGIAIGTPAYMAPEQLAGDPSADGRIDIYAVGLLGYELLTGQQPFSAPSPRETMAAQLTRDPEPVGQVNPTVPPALANLVMRCLAKDPDDRPQTAQLVLATLDGVDTTPSGGTQARIARPSAGKRVVTIGAAVVVLGVAAFALHRRDVERRLALRERQDAANHARSDSIAKAHEQTSPRTAVLTHADSVAIAERVNRQVAAAALKDSDAARRLRDSLSEVELAQKADSIISAYSAEPAGPTRNVSVRSMVLGPQTTELSNVVRAISDSLRAAIMSRSEFIIDNSAPPRRGGPGGRPGGPGGQPGGPPPNVIHVTVSLRRFTGDSVQVLVDIDDPTAVNVSRRRQVQGPKTPENVPLANLTEIVSQSVAFLKQVNAAPRQPARGGGGLPGPDSD